MPGVAILWARPLQFVNRQTNDGHTRLGIQPLDRGEPFLRVFGGVICAAVVLVALMLITPSHDWPQPAGLLPALAAEQPNESIRLADRTSCEEIGVTDLRSPPEGLWFQSNCIAQPAVTLIASSTNCNRTSMDPAEFAPVAPGLYVTGRAPAYLWYASADACFDLVSTRVVTAVCTDQTVTFDWNSRACSAHGGVQSWVNGR